MNDVVNLIEMMIRDWIAVTFLAVGTNLFVMILIMQWHYAFNFSIKEKDFKWSIERSLKKNRTWILTNGYLPTTSLNSNFQASSVFHMNKENITALNQLYGDLYDDFSVYNTPLDRVKALYPLTYEFHHFNL